MEERKPKKKKRSKRTKINERPFFRSFFLIEERIEKKSDENSLRSKRQQTKQTNKISLFGENFSLPSMSN